MDTSNINEYLISAESLIGGRQENQDNDGLCQTILGTLVVVCDGMGGGPAGKTASTLATESIIGHVKGASANADPKKVLADAVAAANMTVIRAQIDDRSLMGMGTTCVVLLLCGSTAYIIHVGDSRCYQLRGKKMVFRTNDHSLVGELVRSKSLTEEEARTAGNANIITRAIGIKPTLEPEIDVVKVKPGDRFALMSDGIWGALPQPDLINYLVRKESIANIVADLTQWVDAAGKNRGNTHDNLTLAMVQVPDNKVKHKSASQQARSNNDSTDGKSRLKVWTIALITAVVIGILATSHIMIWGGDKVTDTEQVDGTEEQPLDNDSSHTCPADVNTSDADTNAQIIADVRSELAVNNAKNRCNAIVEYLRDVSDCLSEFPKLVNDQHRSAPKDTLTKKREKCYEALVKKTQKLQIYRSDDNINKLIEIIRSVETRQKLKQVDRHGRETRDAEECHKMLTDRINAIIKQYNDSINSMDSL